MKTTKRRNDKTTQKADCSQCAEWLSSDRKCRLCVERKLVELVDEVRGRDSQINELCKKIEELRVFNARYLEERDNYFLEMKEKARALEEARRELDALKKEVKRGVRVKVDA